MAVPPPIDEITDLPDSDATTQELLLGQTLDGNLTPNAGDNGDWVFVQVIAGREYQVDMPDRATLDPFLEVYDATGNLIGSDSDSGNDRFDDARVTFIAPYTGIVYIRATHEQNNNAGPYRLTVADKTRFTILGTNADETLQGGGSDDFLEGLGGNDLIDGMFGRDYLSGGAGNDTITSSGGGTIVGGDGEDEITSSFARVYAGADADTITLQSSNGQIFGGDGDDTISHDATVDFAYYNVLGGTGRDFIDFRGMDGYYVLTGGAHDDVILASDGDAYGGDGDDRLHFTGDDLSYFWGYGGEGQDTLSVEVVERANGNTGYGNGILFGGAGDDLIRNFTNGAHGEISAYGEDGNDTMIGGTMRDRFFGGEGDDSIETGGWADYASGGDGSDTIRGGRGNDTAYGGEGEDTVTGEQGNDFISGGAGNDLVRGNIGDDTVWGDAGNDRIEGGFDDDVLGGGAGDDTVYGQAGDDTLYGGAGNDVLYGGDGADTLWGVTGADSLDGGGGADLLRAGLGGDRMFGGGGDDTMVGDSGDDTFVFSAGADVAQDFDVAADILDLSGAAGITDMTDLMANHVSTVGGNAVITDADGDTLTLLVVTEAELATAAITF